MIEPRLMDTIDRDANLGRTVIRLARLAASVHRMEHAQQVLGASLLPTGHRKDQGRIEGLGPRAADADGARASGAPPVGTDAARPSRPNPGSPSVHTEVNR